MPSLTPPPPLPKKRNTVNFTTDNKIDFFPHTPADANPLPVGTFILNQHPMRGFFLTRVPDMAIPSRIYGTDHSERILRAFDARRRDGHSTGVWLNGEKGSGKTMLAGVLSLKTRERGLPTILIQRPYSGPAFNELIQSLGPCCLLFDEFEKVYSSGGSDRPSSERDTSAQDDLLTLFAGSVQAANMYIVTTNSSLKVHEAMKNRPSRLRYALQYHGVAEDVARDYVTANMRDAASREAMLTALASVPNCNFDIMQAAVEEHNLLGGDVEDLLAIMNITRDGVKYDAVFSGSISLGDDDPSSWKPWAGRGVVRMPTSGETEMGVRFTASTPEATATHVGWHVVVRDIKWDVDAMTYVGYADGDSKGRVVFTRKPGQFSTYQQSF